MDRSRWAAIGDLVIQKSELANDDRRWTGVVYEIVYDKYNHGKVFINWAEPPPNYYKEHGYAASNIHNQRSRFDVVKI